MRVAGSLLFVIFAFFVLFFFYFFFSLPFVFFSLLLLVNNAKMGSARKKGPQVENCWERQRTRPYLGALSTYTSRRNLNTQLGQAGCIGHHRGYYGGTAVDGR